MKYITKHKAYRPSPAHPGARRVLSDILGSGVSWVLGGGGVASPAQPSPAPAAWLGGGPARQVARALSGRYGHGPAPLFQRRAVGRQPTYGWSAASVRLVASEGGARVMALGAPPAGAPRGARVAPRGGLRVRRRRFRGGELGANGI